MPLADKNILITPNRGAAADPTIVFSGANVAVGPQNITATALPLSNGTVSFSGSAGQLFSITNSLTGTIFSVNDVSGIPSIEVNSSGVVSLAPLGGNVGIGTTTPASRLSVQQSGISTNTTVINAVTQTTAVAATLFDFDQYTTVDGNGSSMLRFRKANGTVTVPTLVGANRATGRVGSQLYDGAAFYDNVLIRFASDGTPALNSTPGRIEFWTTPSGSAGGLVERMRISSAGNVGINTDSPEQRLTVIGSIALGATSANQSSRIEVADGSSTAGDARFLFRNGTDTNAALRMVINSADNLNLDAVQANNTATVKNLILQTNGGNIGVSTSSPGAKLTVSGGNYRQVTAATGGTSGYELFDAASGGNHIGSFTRRDNGIGIASFDYISAWTGATTGISSGSERMRVTNTGDVGIGTSTPRSRLQASLSTAGAQTTLDTGIAFTAVGNAISALTTTTVQTILRLHQPNSINVSKGSTFGIGLSFWENPGNNFPRTRADFLTTGRTTDNSNAGFTVMSLRDDGRVGIGTTTPTATLDVVNVVATASATLTTGDYFTATRTLNTSNWYRIATWPATNTGQECEIHIRQPNTHANTVVKLSKGTGQWRAEVYRAGFYVAPQAGYPGVNLVRIVDVGINNVTHIDIQMSGATQASEFAIAVVYNISTPTTRLQLVDFVDQGTAAAGTVFPAVGTLASWGCSNGQRVTFSESGDITVGNTGSQIIKARNTAKWWVTSNGFISIQSSYGVASVTDSGSNIISINYAIATTGGTYAAAVSVSHAGGLSWNGVMNNASAPSTTSTNYRFSYNDGGAPYTPFAWSAVGFGDQA